jgi:hypothetical protein
MVPALTFSSYERIWRRINEHLPTNTVREKARQILGWVGCSPVPLTIRELEQALLINPADIEQRPTGMSGMTVLDIVRICGPVVEDANDELHFVHFTAKQYDHLSPRSSAQNELTITPDISSAKISKSLWVLLATPSNSQFAASIISARLIMIAILMKPNSSRMSLTASIVFTTTLPACGRNLSSHTSS